MHRVCAWCTALFVVREVLQAANGMSCVGVDCPSIATEALPCAQSMLELFSSCKSRVTIKGVLVASMQLIPDSYEAEDAVSSGGGDGGGGLSTVKRCTWIPLCYAHGTAEAEF